MEEASTAHRGECRTIDSARNTFHFLQNDTYDMQRLYRYRLRAWILFLYKHMTHESKTESNLELVEPQQCHHRREVNRYKLAPIEL